MKVGNILSKPPDEREFQSTDVFVLPRCRVGVEIELEQVEQIPRGGFRGLWTIKTDGSLHRGGLEFVFTEPLFGGDVVIALRNLQDEVTKYHKEYGGDLTDQNTSVHVHIDARDVTPNELERWCKLYWLYESVLFKIIGVDRETNPFCFPLKETKEAIYNIWSAFNALNKNSKASVQYLEGFQRYSALNLAALSLFGSIEFRGHPGSYDANRILEWIDILLCLKRAGTFEHISYDRPYLAFKEYGIESVTRSIFGKYTDLIINVPDFFSLIEDGKAIVRQLSNKPELVNHLSLLNGFKEYRVNEKQTESTRTKRRDDSIPVIDDESSTDESIFDEDEHYTGEFREDNITYSLDDVVSEEIIDF